MIISYSALLLGLILHWFFIWEGKYDTVQVINVLIAYLVAAILNVIFVEDVKRKNIKINQEILDISQKDELTGLWNRRIVNKVLSEFESSYTREMSEYAVIVIDINNFKSINDQYGHQVGDSALVFVASCIQNNIRAIDYAFRVGGDEFLIVLSCKSIETALNICTKINLALNEDLGFTFKISISSGYEIRSNGHSITDILERADKHMYQNKKIPIINLIP
jgi:diguanylate cyclase (GGDEF) domain